MITLMLVEDHLTLRQALYAVFTLESDLQVTAQTAHGGEAVTLAAEQQPDVAVIDLDLPDGSGVEVVERVRGAAPGCRCVVLTALRDDVELGRAIQAGASAVLHKSVEMEALLQAIRTVASGATVLPPDDTSRRLRALERARQQEWQARVLWDSLTGRELQVLELLAEGADGRHIARDLGISPHTAETHIRNLLGKLDARSRLEAVVKALRLGLVNPPR